MYKYCYSNEGAIYAKGLWKPALTENNFYHSVTDLLISGFCSIPIPACRIKIKQNKNNVN